MAYTQSPGRPPFPQTGRGISPAMMSGSAMKQVKTPTKPPTVTDIELNKSYTEGVEKSKRIATANPEAQAKRDTVLFLQLTMSIVLIQLSLPVLWVPLAYL